jgi:hypothetical protein
MGPGPAKNRVTIVEIAAATSAGPKKIMLKEPTMTSITKSAPAMGVL